MEQIKLVRILFPFIAIYMIRTYSYRRSYSYRRMGCAVSRDASSDLCRLRLILQTQRSIHPTVTISDPAALLAPAALLQLELPGVILSSTDAAVVGRALSYMPALQLLDLRDCGLDLLGMHALGSGMGAANLDALQTLLIGGNWIECMFGNAVACVEALCTGLLLGGARNLASLSVPNGMLPKGAMALCETLAMLEAPLTALDVSDSRFGCGGARALRDAHDRAPFAHLQHLDLFAGHIGPRGCLAICQMLCPQPASTPPLPGPALRTLCLADNAIEDSGLAALARALRGSPTLAACLTDLDLSSNGLGMHGDDSLPSGTCALAEFAHALRDAQEVGLRRLNLSQNFLADEGLLPIANHALPALAHLEMLEISCVNARDVGLNALAQFFAGAPAAASALTTLGIYNQPRVSAGAVARLMRALCIGAPSLQRLHAGKLPCKDDRDDADGDGALGSREGGCEGDCGPGREQDSSSEDSAAAAEATIELIEHSHTLAFVDLRGTPALPPALAARLERAVESRGGALVVCPPTAPWADNEAQDIFASMEGWHLRGLAESRTMYCRFKQTVWFMEGDDAGAELNQPQFVIEEPGGETSLAQDP